jgi:hypothetical protein
MGHIPAFIWAEDICMPLEVSGFKIIGLNELNMQRFYLEVGFK